MQQPAAESVWDYPRPPALRHADQHIEVWLGGEQIVACGQALQVLETSHPPTYYLPADAFVDGALVSVEGTTWCEFKGHASYFDVRGGGVVAARAAWTYREPSPGYGALRGRVSLMPGAMDRCVVDGQTVQAQQGDFYGGWITSAVRGPFKGAPGTGGW